MQVHGAAWFYKAGMVHYMVLCWVGMYAEEPPQPITRLFADVSASR